LDINVIKNWAILDSGATSHFLTSTAPMTNITPTTTPIVTQLPNSERVMSTHTCTLNIPTLHAAARRAHIIPHLASHSLILVVTLCNAGCDIAFTKIECTISYRGRPVLCANKCIHTGSWMIPLTPTPAPAAPPTVLPPGNLPTTIAANVDATLTAAKYARFVY
jgi:hypothetical protein